MDDRSRSWVRTTKSSQENEPVDYLSRISASLLFVFSALRGIGENDEACVSQLVFGALLLSFGGIFAFGFDCACVGFFSRINLDYSC